MKRHLLLRCAGLLGLAASGCAAPDMSLATTQLDFTTVQGSDLVDEAFIEKIEGAEERLRVALPAVADTALSDALIEAFDRGVDVEVVTDIDHSGDAGAVALADAGVPLTLADDGVTYFEFALNQDVAWDSADVRMSNAFVVADQVDLAAATSAGDGGEGWRVLVEGRSEDMAEDLRAEHNQLMAGTDASSLTAFSSLAKSVLDNRWAYPTQQDLVMELWFGPQERLIKRIIDAVYRSRASVWVLTGQIADEGLARALQAKAANGFDVRVIVGAEHSDSITDPAAEFARNTPDVLKYRATVEGGTPTVVIVDYALDPFTDTRRTTLAFVLTHELVSAARLYQGGEVATDQLIDGTLFVARELDEPTEDLEALVELLQTHLDGAEAF